MELKHLTGTILTALSLLIALPLCAAQTAKHGSSGLGEMSDLNHDRSVDGLDLEIFSTTYLKKDWEEVDWCNFHHTATANPKFFRKQTATNPARFTRLLKYIANNFGCSKRSRAVDKSDLNVDRQINLADLAIFSTVYLERYWETVEWCQLYERSIEYQTFEGHRTKYYLQHFRVLLEFVNDHFDCHAPSPPPGDILLENEPIFLARMATPPDQEDVYYITDPRVASVFIYDADLVLTGEIKGLSQPLGVAIDSRGNLLVGNDGRDNIEVYDPANGELLAVFGEGIVKMPNAITVDMLGDIYVTDSRSHNIKVFDPAYRLIRTIGSPGQGDGELDFPTDTEVFNATNEVFVADQANRRIQVYSLDGNWLREISQICWFGCSRKPVAKMLQALASDSLGRLHALDILSARVVIFDPTSGTAIGTYGAYGEGPGQLRMPVDLLISDTDESLVTSGDGDRIETMEIPW